MTKEKKLTRTPVEKINLSEVIALIASFGCIYLYLQSKKQSSEARRAIMEQRNAEANEIHKQAQELRDGIVKKKEEYEKLKLKVFAVHDGDKSDDKPDSES
jgi:hypothetical protein